jgi:hypothetical protein
MQNRNEHVSESKYEYLFTFRNVTLNPKANADLRYNTLLGLFNDVLNHHHHRELRRPSRTVPKNSNMILVFQPSSSLSGTECQLLKTAVLLVPTASVV